MDARYLNAENNNDNASDSDSRKEIQELLKNDKNKEVLSYSLYYPANEEKKFPKNVKDAIDKMVSLPYQELLSYLLITIKEVLENLSSTNKSKSEHLKTFAMLLEDLQKKIVKIKIIENIRAKDFDEIFIEKTKSAMSISQNWKKISEQLSVIISEKSKSPNFLVFKEFQVALEALLKLYSLNSHVEKMQMLPRGEKKLKAIAELDPKISLPVIITILHRIKYIFKNESKNPTDLEFLDFAIRILSESDDKQYLGAFALGASLKVLKDEREKATGQSITLDILITDDLQKLVENSNTVTITKSTLVLWEDLIDWLEGLHNRTASKLAKDAQGKPKVNATIDWEDTIFNKATGLTKYRISLFYSLAANNIRKKIHEFNVDSNLQFEDSSSERINFDTDPLTCEPVSTISISPSNQTSVEMIEDKKNSMTKLVIDLCSQDQEKASAILQVVNSLLKLNANELQEISQSIQSMVSKENRTDLFTFLEEFKDQKTEEKIEALFFGVAMCGLPMDVALSMHLSEQLTKQINTCVIKYKSSASGYWPSNLFRYYKGLNHEEKGTQADIAVGRHKNDPVEQLKIVSDLYASLYRENSTKFLTELKSSLELCYSLILNYGITKNKTLEKANSRSSLVSQGSQPTHSVLFPVPSKEPKPLFGAEQKKEDAHRASQSPK